MLTKEQPSASTAVSLVFPSRTGLSLREIADVIFRQKLMVSVWIFLIGGALISYLVLAPNRYKSQMRFLLMAQRPIPSTLPADTQTGAPAEITDAQVATEMQMMQSPETIKRVVESSGLVQPGKASYQERLSRAEARFRKSMIVTPDGKSDLISVSYQGSTPAEANSVLKAFAAAYLTRQYEIHKAAGGVEFFKSEAERFEGAWRKAQERLSAFEQKTKVVSLDEQKDLAIRKLNELEMSLRQTESAKSEADQRTVALQQQLSRVSPRIVTQQRTLPDQYTAEHLRTEIVNLKNKKTELLTKFLPSSRMVQEVDEQLAQTQKALDDLSTIRSSEEATDVNPLRQGIESRLVETNGLSAGLDARTDTLKKQIGQERWVIDQLGMTTAEYQALVSDVKENEAKYLLYSRQSEQSRIAEEMNRERVTSVLVADPPSVPAGPEAKVSVNLIFGALLAMILILIASFIKGLRRVQVFTPWELEGVVGVPVLGTVPEAPQHA
jgi:polysaccharide biosynthesis protein PslE